MTENIKPVPGGESPGPPPSASPVLDQFGEDLTRTAREGRLRPVSGREKEIERVTQVLCRRMQNNPVLVGEPGVGRTAVAHGLAHRIAVGEVPPLLAGKHLYAVDLPTLTQALSSQGSDGERLPALLSEIRARGDVILLVDNLHDPRAAGGADLPALLKPLLASGRLQVIGELTAAQWRDYLAADPAAQRVFQPVPVAEPTIAHTIEILKSLRDRFEAHHRVSITDQALRAAAELASRALPGRRLPGKAIDLMDEAASLVQTRRQASPPDLPEFAEKIAEVRRDKEAAIDAQDFEKAAALRDTEKQLLASKAARRKEWKAATLATFAIVEERHVAETLAIMTGLSADAAPGQQRPLRNAPPFPPAAMTGDDREIWSLS